MNFTGQSLVKQGHAGVWFGPGGRVKQVPPGLHCYWPITSALIVVSTLERSSEVATQLHGREAVSIAVLYRIADPMRILLAQNDIFSMLDDRAQAALAAAYRVEATNDEMAIAICASLLAEFASQGVDVHRVNVLQRGRVIPLKNLNDWANHAKAEL